MARVFSADADRGPKPIRKWTLQEQERKRRASAFALQMHVADLQGMQTGG
jgi:hypothetical protein